MSATTNPLAATKKLTREQRAEVRSLIDDSGHTRAEAVAWVTQFPASEASAVARVDEALATDPDAPIHLSVQLNGDPVYAGNDEDAAFTAYTRAAKTMRYGDTLVMYAGDKIHLATIRVQA